MWRQLFGSTVVQMLPCCLSALSYYFSEPILINKNHQWNHAELQMSYIATYPRGQWVNTLRPRRNLQHFTDDIFKRIFFNENVRIPINNSLKFLPKGPVNNIPLWVQIMVWRRPGAKPLSEPMMVSLLAHICVTWPQWVKRRLPPKFQERFSAWPKFITHQHFTPRRKPQMTIHYWKSYTPLTCIYLLKFVVSPIPLRCQFRTNSYHLNNYQINVFIKTFWATLH